MINSSVELSDDIKRVLQKFVSDMASTKINPAENDPLHALNQSEQLWNFGAVTSIKPVKKWQSLHNDEVHADNGSPSFLVPQEVKDALDKKVTAEDLVEYANPRLNEKQLLATQSYFTRIGVIDDNVNIIDSHTQPEKYEKYINDNQTKFAYTAQIADGTSRLFQYALTQIIRNKGDIIVVTAPCYGLFINPILEQGGRIENLAVDEKNNFKLNAKQLGEVIKQRNLEFINAFLEQISWLKKKMAKLNDEKYNHSFKKKIDNLLKNLSDLCKKKHIDIELIEKMTQEVNASIRAEASKQDKVNRKEKLLRLELRPLNRVRGFLNVNPTMPLGKILTQDEIDEIANELVQHDDLIVLDDITYYDIVLPPFNKKPGTFAKSSKVNKTITFYGLSKQFGLPSLRSAIAIGPNELLQPMIERAFHHNPSKNAYSEKGMDAVFSLNDTTRQKYLGDVCEDYALRRDFAIAMFKGIKHIVNAKYAKEIERLLIKNKVPQKQIEQLLQGVPNINILTIPDSGFFIVLDLSYYQNQYLGTCRLSTSLNFYLTLKQLLNIETLPLEMCFDTQFCGLRFSYAIPPINIAESALRLSKLLSCMTNSPASLEILDKEAAVKSESPSFLVSYNKRVRGKRTSRINKSTDFEWEQKPKTRNVTRSNS